MVLGTSEIMWLSKVIQEGFIAGFILLATANWMTFIYYRFYLFMFYFNERKMSRRYPEAVVITQLIQALSLVNGKPEQKLGNDIKKELLVRLEHIAYRLEKDLIRKLPSCDIGTNVWSQRCGHQMATGIRLLKRCVLIPKKERRERFVATLGTRLVNAADGDWGLFEQVELSTVSTWSSRGLLIMRRFIALAFPLMIVGIIVIIPIKLSDTVMGYIFAASIGWAAITILTWLDPDYHEKIDAFKEKSDILPRRKK